MDQNLILLDDAPLFNTSHVFGFFSVFGQKYQGLRQCLWPIGWDKDTISGDLIAICAHLINMSHEIPDTPHVSGHHRFCRGHGLNQRHTEGFDIAGRHNHMRFLKELSHLHPKRLGHSPDPHEHGRLPGPLGPDQGIP